MPITVTLPDDLVDDIRTYGALRRIACGNPEEGDYDAADVDPVDWDDHRPSDESELFEAADDLATDIIGSLAVLMGDVS
jgi:hypothetical protein